MATLLSIPTSVTILAPGSSVLSTVVACHGPGIMGSTSALETSLPFLASGLTTGSMLPYCNAMPWNPVNSSHRDHRRGSPLATPHAACAICRGDQFV